MPLHVRINDLARELEVKGKAILEVLPVVGITEKKTHSSSVSIEEAEKVRSHFRSRDYLTHPATRLRCAELNKLETRLIFRASLSRVTFSRRSSGNMSRSQPDQTNLNFPSSSRKLGGLCRDNPYTGEKVLHCPESSPPLLGPRTAPPGSLGA